MIRRQIIFYLFLTLILSSCARIPKSEPSAVKESDFGIPQDLAKKFAVSENQAQAIPVLEKTTKQDAGANVSSSPKKAPKRSKKEKAPSSIAPPTANGANAAATNTAAKPQKTIDLNVNRWQVPQSFFPGEKHSFDVTYFGTTAGNVELTVLPYKFIGYRQVFEFKGYARSTSIFALFYRLNDVISSFMDKEGLFTHKFTVKLDETLQQRDLIELYDQKSAQLHYWSRLDHKNKGLVNDQFSAEIQPFTQDVLSAVFYLRTLPLEVGKTFTFPVVSNGKPWTVEAHVVRREELNTKAGKFDAFVIKPDTKFEGVLKTTGDSFIWIGADEHRAILKIDAKVKIGSVIAYLRELSYGQP